MICLKKFAFSVVMVFATGICIGQKQTIDSLLTLLKKDKEDTNKVNHLNALAIKLYSGNPDTSALLSTQALQLSEKQNWKKGIAGSCMWLGWCKSLQGDYPKALDYDFKALRIAEEINDKKIIASTLGTIGSVYWNQGDYPKALDYYFKALKLTEELGNKNGIAKHLGNIGLLYYYQANYPKALEYDFKAFKMAEELGNKQLQANTLGNIALVYSDQAASPEISLQRKTELQQQALDYYFKSLSISEELGSKSYKAVALANIGSLYTETKKYAEAEKYLLDALKLDEEIGALDGERQDEELLANLYMQTSRYKLALEHYKKAMELKDTLFNEEKDKEITRKEMNYEFEKKEAAAKAEQDKKDAVAAEESRRQKIIRNSIAGGLGAVMIFSFIVFRQRNRIAKEKKRSDELLLNILPSETAEELKLTGHAEPKQFDMVTVLFTDFKGFTQIAEKMSAKELVGELDFVFKKFDEIISKYPIEKIKTIGDAYMCAGGLPTANHTNAMDVTLAGLEIQQFMEAHNRQQTSANKPAFEIRIGIHTGPIVAGIVGIKKFAYDIWGDTVNTASRMESSGEAGKVNISGATYELVKDKFNCTYRGKIQAKNKGEIEMYFVEKK